MINLLKTFGKGLLYVLGLPIFLVILAIFAIVGLGMFIFQIIRSIIFFFTGQKFFPEIAEDKELRLMRESAGNNNPVMEEAPIEPVDNTPSIISPFEEPVVKEETILHREEPVQEKPVFVDAPTIEDVCFNEPIQQESEPETNDLAIEPDIPTVEQTFVPVENEIVLDTKVEAPVEEKQDENLETYVPKSSTYETIDDEEENNTDGGVKIDYDL